MKIAMPLPAKGLALLCVALFSGPGFAQDVTLVLTTVKTPAVYHLGERIEVSLTFSADGNNFGFTDFTTERASVWEREKFRAVSLDNGAGRIRAPYDPYFDLEEYGWATVGSHLYSTVPLSKTPRKLSFDLNSWLRITSPGRYGITAESHRVTRFADPELRVALQHVPLKSNQVEITIVPADPEWVSGELRNIRETLDSSGGESDRISAVRRLSYLGTPDSTAEMAARFVASDAGTYRDVLFQALLEASARDAAIAALEAGFRDSRKELFHEIYEVLATLYLVREVQGKPLPSEDQARINAIQERNERYHALLDGLHRRRPEAQQ
jgi:hypothetical protein